MSLKSHLRYGWILFFFIQKLTAVLEKLSISYRLGHSDKLKKVSLFATFCALGIFELFIRLKVLHFREF